MPPLARAPVYTTRSGIEFSIHPCPRRLEPEVRASLPGIDPKALVVVPVCQRATEDLSGLGPAIEAEKDRLLERFSDFAEKTRELLASRQIWCDLVDPCSGLLAHSPSPSPYDEVSALGLLRGFRALPLGCCRVALHPRWGARVYPATIFVKGSTHDALQALAEAGGGIERIDDQGPEPPEGAKATEGRTEEGTSE